MYDAVIIGGGPAGLSIGSELSKKHKILLIEKEKIGETSKTWTTETRLLKKTGLEKFITARFKKNYTKSYNSDKYYVNADIATVDEKKLLLHLKSKIKKPSCVFENCSFKKIAGAPLAVSTSKGIFRCRLIIDCMGINSDIAAQNNLFKKIFYYPTYGEILEIKKPIEPILLEVLFPNDPVAFFEVFPYDKKSILTYTFKYLPRKTDPLKLESLHRKNKDLAGYKNFKIIRKVYGTIPMGIMHKHTLDNIFFFGDSSLIGAPLIGSGFTNIIQHSKKFSSHISKKLKENKLSEEDLNYNYSDIEQLNRDAQLILGMIFLHIKPEYVEVLFKSLKNISRKALINLLFLRMDVGEIIEFSEKIIRAIGIRTISKIVPKEEYLFITNELANILKDITAEEVHEMLHKHHNSV